MKGKFFIRKELIALLSLFIPLTAYAQTVLTSSRNMFREGDVLSRKQIEDGSIGQRGENVVWDFSDVQVLNRNFRQKFAAVPDTCLLACTERGTRYYYQLEGDSLLLKGFENNLTKLDYVRPQAMLRFPVHYGDSIGGVYQAHGFYCDRQALHCYGRYKTVADGSGTLVLPGGDTLRNVLRVRTLSKGIDRLSARDRKTEIPSSGDTLHVVRETIRWYAAGYRYPIMESTTTIAKGDRHYSAMYYCPPEEQLYLALDDENRQYREEMQQSGNGNNGGSDATGANITYHVTQNKDARRLTVDFSLSERQQVDFILSDPRGVVHRSLSRTGEAGVSQTVDINYGGLRRGQYVLYIRVNGKQYAEKFNVK